MNPQNESFAGVQRNSYSRNFTKFIEKHLFLVNLQPRPATSIKKYSIAGMFL